jgi:hypothetical protein
MGCAASRRLHKLPLKKLYSPESLTTTAKLIDDSLRCRLSIIKAPVIFLRRDHWQHQISFLLPIPLHCDCASQESSFTCILWAQKCLVTPIFLFAINLIGFFYVDCPTLSKINRAVFCQGSLLKQRVIGYYILLTEWLHRSFSRLSASMVRPFRSPDQDKE